MDTVTDTRPWTSVVFVQGEDLDTVLEMLYDIDGVVWSGPYAESIARTVEYLAQWDYGDETDHSPYCDPPWGPHDSTAEHGDYVLAWESRGLYVSLNRRAPLPACALCAAGETQIHTYQPYQED